MRKLMVITIMVLMACQAYGEQLTKEQLNKVADSGRWGAEVEVKPDGEVVMTGYPESYQAGEADAAVDRNLQEYDNQVQEAATSGQQEAIRQYNQYQQEQLEQTRHQETEDYYETMRYMSRQGYGQTKNYWGGYGYSRRRK